MSTAKISRLNELREYAKRRIAEDINKTLDQVFDILIDDCLPNQQKTKPSLWPSLGGLGADTLTINAGTTSLITGNHQAANDYNPLKRTWPSKQSTFESFLADGDGSSSTSSGTEFNLFNSASLKKIFDQAYHEYTPMTPDECSSEPASSSSLTNGGCSDCECDHSNANCAIENDAYLTGSRFLEKDLAINDLMAEINQKVFFDKEIPLLKSSCKESNASLNKESHFVVPPVLDTFGPITPPSKSGAWGSSVVSFAKVAALSAAKSPTKTAKSSTKSSQHVLTVIGRQNSSKKSGQGVGAQQAQQQYDYNHQFRTRQVNCFVDKCRSFFAIVPMLNEHLKAVHGMQKHRCPLIASCGISFADS